jgi:hypothetical protein
MRQAQRVSVPNLTPMAVFHFPQVDRFPVDFIPSSQSHCCDIELIEIKLYSSWVINKEARVLIRNNSRNTLLNSQKLQPPHHIKWHPLLLTNPPLPLTPMPYLPWVPIFLRHIIGTLMSWPSEADELRLCSITNSPSTILIFLLLLAKVFIVQVPTL